MRALTISLLALPALASAQSVPSPPGDLDWGTDWVDYDRDGRVDSLLLDGQGPMRLFRNLGQGAFEDVTERVGFRSARGVTRALWHDFDRDGHLDVLLVAPAGVTELYRADGVGGFLAAGQAVGLNLTGPVEDARWLDVNDDRSRDLLVMTSLEHRLYQSDSNGAFTRVSVPLRPAARMDGTGRASELSISAAEQDSVQSPALERTGPTHSLQSGTGLVSTTPAPPAAPASAGQTCASSVDDVASVGNCLSASSVPTLGMLYPLTSDWFVDGAGSVGLGTTTPTARLDVDGTIRSRSGGIEFPDGSVQTSATLMGPPGSDALWQVAENHMHHATGRVGIGNDDPEQRLHVTGDVLIDRLSTSGITRSLTLEGARNGTETAYAALNLGNFDSNGSQVEYVGAQIKSHNASVTDSGDLRFSVSDGGGLAEALRITPEGRVGVSTTNPQTTLDVAGAVRSRTGGFEFPDGTVQTTAYPFGGEGVTSVGPGAFVALGGTATVKNDPIDGVWVDGTGTAALVAPITLPHGARLTSLTAYVYDNVAPTNLRIELVQKRNAAHSSDTLAIAQVNESFGYDSDTVPISQVVDNTDGGYHLIVHPITSTWPGTPNLALMNVVVTWTAD